MGEESWPPTEGTKEGAVSAGKYPSDKLYPEVEKELGPAGPKATLDWELTPNISLETEVKGGSAGSVGLNWRWDC